jgi:hypothetical protein
MKQFVPMTDEMLFSDRPPLARLVPYRSGMACLHRLSHLREQERALIARNKQDAQGPTPPAGVSLSAA